MFKYRVINFILFSLLFVNISGCKVFEAKQKTSLSGKDWILKVNNAIKDGQTGEFFAKDRNGLNIVINWKKFNGVSEDLKQELMIIKDAYLQANVTVMIKFLKDYPKAVNTIDKLKPMEQVFAAGVENVDWEFLEPILTQAMGQDFVEGESSRYTKDDILIFASIKEEKGNEIIGFVQFLVSERLGYSVIKVSKLMLCPAAQHRGVGKLLISSIFKIFSGLNSGLDIERLILRVFKSNEQAIAAYKSYGFKQYKPAKESKPEGFGVYEFNFEYKTKECDLLQKEVGKLK